MTNLIHYDKVFDPGSDYQMRIDYDGGANPVYIGRAIPGSTTDQDKWQIRKLTYDGDNVTAVQFAGGHNTFGMAWDDRATYTYS